MKGLIARLLGDQSGLTLRRLEPKVKQINELEPTFEALSLEALKSKTEEFRGRLGKGEILEQLLPEAFALVREAAKRVLGQRHFDVQLLGGMVLFEGKIAEMKTGEGKTLAATLPLYLHALVGRGAHLVTVNDYLARRDCAWMGPVFASLGLTVGVINQVGKSFKFNEATLQDEKLLERKSAQFNPDDYLLPCSRKEAYQCDITYGTNNEFGFDYLRDNMVSRLSEMAQRELYFAIVDEVDSILVDESRTPLIISGPAEESASLYQDFARLVLQLEREKDYSVDEKHHSVTISEAGHQRVEELSQITDLYDPKHIILVHHLEEALKAKELFKRDKDYIVEGDEIVIVDEFTGRKMPGRRFSEGLHQAIEAKEGVEVKQESDTLATISFQNLFRLYERLSGMTGTALTEKEEFYKIYGLDVVAIPTHREMIRLELPDQIYKNRAGKLTAIVSDIKSRHERGQPVLVGTVSVSRNEELSQLLTNVGVKHEVLNAKNHEREAMIIAKAGEKGAVTVATNMAGRGTDIVPDREVVELGGLHVLATERHESRRIDNQLRGRSGRQGDPGSSQFYVSLEDDLMRIFGGEAIKKLMERLGLPEDQPIEHRLVTNAIHSAQKRVEGHNFDIRKHLLEFDDVLNRHRLAIYTKRRRILEALEGQGETSLREELIEMLQREISRLIHFHADDPENLRRELGAVLESEVPDDLSVEGVGGAIRAALNSREERFSKATFDRVIGLLYFQAIDRFWVEHLNAMETLREGIYLRGFAQRDPLTEYRREAHQLFEHLNQAIEGMVARTIFHVEIQASGEAPAGKTPGVYGISTPGVAEAGVEAQEKQQLEYKGADESLAGGGFQTVEGEDDESVLAQAPAQAERATSEVKVPDTSEVKEVASLPRGQAGEEVKAGVVTTVRRARVDEPVETTISKRAPSYSAEQVLGRKIGRNEPCPCGATHPDGRPKKFKHCHGKNR